MTLLEILSAEAVAGADQFELIRSGRDTYINRQLSALTTLELIGEISRVLEEAGIDLTPRNPEEQEQCDRCGGTGYAQADGLPCSGVCMNCQGLGTITGPPYGGTVSCGRCRGTGKEPTPPAKADRPFDPPTYRACTKCKPPTEE